MSERGDASSKSKSKNKSGDDDDDEDAMLTGLSQDELLKKLNAEGGDGAARKWDIKGEMEAAHKRKVPDDAEIARKFEALGLDDHDDDDLLEDPAIVSVGKPDAPTYQ